MRVLCKLQGRLGFVAQLLTWLKPHLSPLFAWSAVASPGMVGRLPDTVILTLQYIAAEMSGETFLISAKRPVYYNAEQFRTDAKCTHDIIVLGGWELESRRWFSLKLDRTQVPYLFKPDGGGAQWASTSAFASRPSLLRISSSASFCNGDPIVLRYHEIPISYNII